jgi:aspartyl-tRNA(Asn)/glutamyl-tRNA(Gln) amidotransferase subunit C
MSGISSDVIEDVEILAKLQLTLEEKVKAGQDMEEMIEYFDKMNELDTEGVEPLTHIFNMGNVMREDEITNEDGSEDALKNAPEKHNMAFVVPKTVG